MIDDPDHELNLHTANLTAVIGACVGAIIGSVAALVALIFVGVIA
jgi:hypothetical protein